MDGSVKTEKHPVPDKNDSEDAPTQVSRRTPIGSRETKPGIPPVSPPSFLVSPELRRQVELAVEAGSFDLAPGAVFCEPGTMPPPGPGRILVFTTGSLSAAAADILRRPDRPLLCALRAGDRATDWELALALGCMGKKFTKPRTALWTRREVTSYQEMLDSADWANDVVQRAGLPNAVRAQVADVAHELVTNALLSAPVDKKGKPRYANQRDNVEVDPQDACELQVGVENARVYLLAKDRYGTLSLDPVVRAVQRYEGRVRVDTAGGGAGLGFRRMLEHCDVMLTHVRRGAATQVLCAISADNVRRRRASPKSVLMVEE